MVVGRNVQPIMDLYKLLQTLLFMYLLYMELIFLSIKNNQNKMSEMTKNNYGFCAEYPE